MTTLSRDKAVEAKERMEGKQREAYMDFLNHLASFCKDEAKEKGGIERDTLRLVQDGLNKAFPERDVEAIDVRRAIRPDFHKKTP